MPRLREVMRFRARVLAPGRAPQARPVALGLILVGLLVGSLGVADVLPGAATWAYCLATFGLGAAPLLGGGMRWREVDLEAREGSVQMLGRWGTRLLARKVSALSTASMPGGVVVAVGTSQNRHPTLIEVEDVGQADAICDALAVGNRGLGKLVWSFDSSANLWTRQALSALLMVLSVAAPAMGLLALGPALGWLMMSLIGLTMMQVVLLARDEQSAQIKLQAEGVDLSKARCGWGLVPYHCIREVERTDDGLVLRLEPPHQDILIPMNGLGVLSEPEIEHVMAQIRSASQRARGQGRRVRVADEIIEDLRRGEETTVGWLQRLDTQASALRSGAYRGEGHNVSELWAALEDHDAAPELRVAAARVLVRVQPEEAAPRVALLASEQRDKHTRVALELALEEQDAEELARRLDRCGLWSEGAGPGRPGAG